MKRTVNLVRMDGMPGHVNVPSSISNGDLFCEIEDSEVAKNSMNPFRVDSLNMEALANELGIELYDTEFDLGDEYPELNF